jgi:sec-independent protein translocase protein TatC
MTLQRLRSGGGRLIPWRRGPSQFQRASDGSMTLIEHFLELRSRLFRATLAIVAGMAAGYWLSEPVYEWLRHPYDTIQAQNSEQWLPLQQLGARDGFMLRLKIALWVGLVLSAPIWFYQLWAFIAPGLHRRERRWAYSFGALAIPLFAAGSGLAYAVAPRFFEFLIEAGFEGVTVQLDQNSYISDITTLMLVFGLSFQLPVIVLLLNFSGLVSARRLLHAWRVVVFICFAFSAVFTPDPGPFGMLLLASALCLLYFAAVGVAFINDRRKGRQDPYADLADDEISPLDDVLEPVTAGEPVGAASVVGDPDPVPEAAPLDRRYDDPSRYDDMT